MQWLARENRISPTQSRSKFILMVRVDDSSPFAVALLLSNVIFGLANQTVDLLIKLLALLIKLYEFD